jgi:hypothetical protein
MKKINFASTLTNSTTYAGEELESFILKAFTQSKFVESLPAQNIVTDIKYKTKIGKIDGSDLVQVGENCTFNDSGTVVVSEAVLEPKPFFINIQMCYEDLEPIFNTLNSGSLNEQELSANFSAALTDLLVSKMNYTTQNVFINGVYNATGTTALTQFDGIDKQILSGTTVTGATLSASNIIASLSKLVAVLPEDVLEAEDLSIYMSRKTLQLYFDALAALASLTPQDTMKPNYMGIPIITVPTIAADKMYCLQTSNIYVGVGALDEFSALQIIDMKPLGQGNNVRMILQGKCDVKLGWASEAAKFDAA